jgi:hypothetical protein
MTNDDKQPLRFPRPVLLETNDQAQPKKATLGQRVGTYLGGVLVGLVLAAGAAVGPDLARDLGPDSLTIKHVRGLVTLSGDQPLTMPGT